MVLTRTKASLAMLAALSMLTVGACTRTQQYTATGAVIGAGGGALIGAAAGGGGAVVAGAAIGGVAGAAAGYIIAQNVP